MNAQDERETVSMSRAFTKENELTHDEAINMLLDKCEEREGKENDRD